MVGPVSQATRACPVFPVWGKDHFPAPAWVPAIMHYLHLHQYNDAAITAIIDHLEATGSIMGCPFLDEAVDRQVVLRLLPKVASAPHRYSDSGLTGVGRAFAAGREV